MAKRLTKFDDKKQKNKFSQNKRKQTKTNKKTKHPYQLLNENGNQ